MAARRRRGFSGRSGVGPRLRSCGARSAARKSRRGARGAWFGLPAPRYGARAAGHGAAAGVSSAARPAPAMTCTIEKILTDAKTLLERLKEHDTAAESLIDQSAVLHQRVAAMREAGAAPAEKGSAAAAPAAASRRARSAPADGADGSRLRPHMLLCQENTQIRDLRQENRGEPAGMGLRGAGAALRWAAVIPGTVRAGLPDLGAERGGSRWGRRAELRAAGRPPTAPW